MRNFVKVLLVGTVLAGACVLLPNDSWAMTWDEFLGGENSGETGKSGAGGTGVKSTTDNSTTQTTGNPTGTTEGAGVVGNMNSLNGKEDHLALLKTHSENSAARRDAYFAVLAAQSTAEAAQAKVTKLTNEKASQDAINKAKGELNKASEALNEINEKASAAETVYQKTKTELDGIVDAAKGLHTQALGEAQSMADRTFRQGTEALANYNQAIEKGDFALAQDIIDNALENGDIGSPEEAAELANRTAAVEGAKAEAEAKQAEVNEAEEDKKKPIEVDLTDIGRIALLTLTPFVTETELALRDDVNVLAGEIGPSVGVVEDTALSDVDTDASVPSSSVAGAATVVAQLLKNATVDLNLLDETFEEEQEPEEPKEPEEPEKPEEPEIQTGRVAGAGSQAGTSANLEEPEGDTASDAGAGTDTAAGSDTGAGTDTGDGKKYLTDEQVNQIREKRQMLLKQYVNAAVQISEGMNAVSNKFADRANKLISFSERVQNEAFAFGLTQDVGRYILFESLRAVALSSAQMGVQAARMLNEQEVDNEIK